MSGASGNSGETIEIRGIATEDRDAVIRIARELVAAGDVFTYDANITNDDIWRYWTPPAPGGGFVAIFDGEIAGVFVIRPNHPGPGSHVANASYAVRSEMRGRGLGRRMGEASLRMAADMGFLAMQFNIVVSTNEPAVRLWQSLGFRIVATIPDGFRLPDGRLTAHHIMHRVLP